MGKPRYLLWIFLAEFAGILSGIFSRGGIDSYASAVNKPSISPPTVLFPVVWTFLYGLMGIGAARVASESPGKRRSQALNMFVVQLTVNFFWSLIFFNAQAFGLAFVWALLLWLLILCMILLFYRVDKPAALLQIPYFLWVTFAVWLSFLVWQMNS